MLTNSPTKIIPESPEDKLFMAQSYAKIWHRHQLYSGLPYDEAHLSPVVQTLISLGYGDDWELLCAGWMHDGPEDAPDSEAQVARAVLIYREFSYRTMELVWAVTGVGENRKERNANAYQKIAETKDAPTLKGVDRLINVMSSKGTSLHEMYLKEYPSFRDLVSDKIKKSLLMLLDEAHGYSSE